MDKPLSDFQRKVIKEFNDLKWIKNSIVDNAPFDETLGKGFLSRLLTSYAKRSLRAFSERSENLKLANQAKEVIENDKVKSVVCKALAKTMWYEVLEEEREIETIKLLTSFLMEKSLSNELPADYDAKLFAYMTYHILNKGIENYCKDCTRSDGTLT